MRRIPWLLAMTGLASGVSLTCYEQGCDRGTGPRCQIVSPMPAATALSAGPHDCVVIGGAAYCWGANASGQLGDGSTMDSKTPVPVAGGPTFLAGVDWRPPPVLGSPPRSAPAMSGVRH